VIDEVSLFYIQNTYQLYGTHISNLPFFLITADPYLVTGMIMKTIMGPEAPEIAPLDKEVA
jgi:hypothetical protein